MYLIQIILILAVFLLVAYLLRARSTAKARASVKIGFIVFMLLGIYAIVRPDDLTAIADKVGVDRGADLMLYLLVVAFGFTTISTYLRFKESELRYARLARAVALQSATPPEPPPPEPTPAQPGPAQPGPAQPGPADDEG